MDKHKPILLRLQRRKKSFFKWHQAEHGYDAVHGLVLPADSAAAVCRIVPVARAGKEPKA
jgi:hypothetical protein